MGHSPETERVLSQFTFTDEDANRAVKEFRRQMAEGLAADGTSLSQIPTFVTDVPNGTEKVVSSPICLSPSPLSSTPPRNGLRSHLHLHSFAPAMECRPD